MWVVSSRVALLNLDGTLRLEEKGTRLKSVILKRIFCAKDLPGYFGLKRAIEAPLRGVWSKSLASAFKSDTSREILRPKAGLRMTVSKFVFQTIGIVFIFGVACTLPLHAQGANSLEQQAGTVSTQRPSILSKVGIDQHLNDQLPLDLSFRDETGKDVRL